MAEGVGSGWDKDMLDLRWIYQCGWQGLCSVMPVFCDAGARGGSSWVVMLCVQ